MMVNNAKFADDVHRASPAMMRFTPGVDTLLDGTEAYTGRDFFSDKKLSTFDNAANKTGIILSVLGLDFADDIADAKRAIKGGSKNLSKQIEALRNGGEVKVKTYEEARELLDNMSELRPATEGRKMPNPDGRMRDGFADPNGTYRGDLINKQNPTGPIHPGVQNPYHANYPHYNIKLPNGEKAAIIIIGE